MNEGIGDKEQTTTYAYQNSSNRRNKKRIRKRLAGMKSTTQLQMNVPKEEKERKLEWLHAQLRKHQQVRSLRTSNQESKSRPEKSGKLLKELARHETICMMRWWYAKHRTEE